MRRWIGAVGLALIACGKGGSTPPVPTSNGTTATVRIVYRGATARRTDLSASAQQCANNLTGITHAHPSWRTFAMALMQPVPPDRYEITFDDVPIDMRVSFRINDQNSCDENPTGAVTRNVSANNVNLVQNTSTPGQGDEPGFAFSVAATGRVTQ